MSPSWIAGVLAGLDRSCVASPFDKLKVTPMQPRRRLQNSVILSLSKETRATSIAGEDAGGPRP
jgi:hypothetical protein